LFIAVVAMLLVVVVVGWQVFGRYVLNDSPIWAERVSLLLMLYLCLLGAAVAVRDNTHLGMDWLIKKLPQTRQAQWQYALYALSAMFGLAMAVNGYALTVTVWDHSMPTLGISEAWNYLPLVLSGSLMVLFAGEHIWAQAKGLAVVPTFDAPEQVTE
jgi:TRAP-type C4-dicarboxylate transport system permease small subunit